MSMFNETPTRMINLHMRIPCVSTNMPYKRTIVNVNFNWNPVCDGGLLAGALAICESETQFARNIVERSSIYLPYQGAVDAPDVTYAEGTAYWPDGKTFQIVKVRRSSKPLHSQKFIWNEFKLVLV